jgi:hypothetical protein
MEGHIVHETPKQVSVLVTKRIFKPKSSATLTHAFSKGQREWFNECLGFTNKFWKETGKEIGGDCWIIDHNDLFN